MTAALARSWLRAVAACATVATVLAGAPAALATPAFLPVAGSPFAAGGDPVQVAFSPSGRLLASANYYDATVSTYSVKAGTGVLAPAAGSPVATGSGPVSVAFGPGGGLLAVANLVDATVSVFSVDPATGGLTQVPGSPFATGNGPRSVAFSPDGGLLAIANGQDGTVSVFTIDPATGTLSPVTGSPFATGNDPVSVAFSPGGRLLATADAAAGAVSVFSVAPASGGLTSVPGSPFPAGAEPYSVAFSPDGGLLATANAQDGTVSVFSLDPANGMLSQVTGSPFATGAEPFSVAFSPAGGLLATADYLGGDVSVFSVDPGSGALAETPGSPFASGAGPHSVQFSPGGGLIASANAAGDTVSMLSLPAPTATILSAVGGITYAPGQHVPTTYSCADSSYGPGIASCTDSDGGSRGAGQLDTSKLGPVTYTVTATSADGLSASSTISYRVAIAVPKLERAPSMRGAALPGHVLSCSTGRWTGNPTSYGYQWSRSGSPVAAATARAYTVQKLDEGSRLACLVTASNGGGAGRPATSKRALVPVPFVRGCPAATGRLSGAGLGLVGLGMTRAQARRAYRLSTGQRSGSAELFCLTPAGLRVGFATPSLLTGLPPAERAHLEGVVVWASTASPHYSFAGIRTGEELKAAELQDSRGTLLTVGNAQCYLIATRAATVVLKAHKGIVETIGIADSRATGVPAARLRLLESFG